MNENTINVFGLELMEPGSFITDILLAIATYTFYSKFKKDKSNTFYSYFFLFMGLSFFFSAFGHLLYHYTGKPLQIFGWIFSALSIYFIEQAVLKEIKSDNLRKRLNFATNLQFLLFIIAVVFFQHFIVVTINLVVGIMGLVVPILGIQAFNQNSKKNILIISGFLFSALPGFLYRQELDFIGLNGKELSHLILIFCFYIIYLGINTQPEREKIKEKVINRM